MSDFTVDVDGIEKTFSLLQRLKEKFQSDPVFVVGTNVEYGVYLEMGTRDMPPYPWFRPAIREFRANPEDFITDNTGYPSVDEIPSTDALVKAVATALQTQMEKNVNAQKATDRSPGTHPEHPRRQDGNLTGDIGAVRIN